MKTTTINVIIVKGNIHEESIVITGTDEAKVVKKANATFLKKVQQYSDKETWKLYNKEDKEGALDDGYFEVDRSTTVYISWPIVVKVR